MNQNNQPNNLPSPIPHVNNNEGSAVNYPVPQGNPFNPGGLHINVNLPHGNGILPNNDDPFWQPVQVAQPIAYNNLQNSGTLNVPRGTMNLISADDIEENDEMVNFHGEKGRKRFYKKSTFNRINHNQTTGRKMNPYTRAPIEVANVRTYKAHLVGGKKTKRKSKTSARTKKSRSSKK